MQCLDVASVQLTGQSTVSYLQRYEMFGIAVPSFEFTSENPDEILLDAFLHCCYAS